MAQLRVTARVVPVSPGGEVLLLLDQDPGRPGELRWGTVGGAVEAGETLTEAAVRELFEETGVVVSAAHLSQPFHRDQREFSYDGTHYLGDSTFFALALGRDVALTFEHLEAGEVGNLVEARWMTPRELVLDGRLVAPDLPDIIRSAIGAVEGTS